MSRNQFQTTGGAHRQTGIRIVLVLCLIFITACKNESGDNKAAIDDKASTVASVVRADITSTITSIGALKPKDYVDVGTQVSGQIRKLYVDIGDQVEKGALIAELDATVYESRVRADRANLNKLKAQRKQQEAQLKLAQQQFARNAQLAKISAASAQALQETETAVTVAAAQIDVTAAEIDAAESALQGSVANLGYTKIYAPMSGTVVLENAVEGQTLNANQSAPVLLRIANLATMTLWAQVAEADVVKVKPGMVAYFTTLGMPDRRWQTTVRQIMPSPETVNDVVLYNVTMDVDNTGNLLLSEMTAQVFFVVGEVKNVVSVPLAALIDNVETANGSYDVKVVIGTNTETRKIQVGLKNRYQAEVISGLIPGDQVVIAPPSDNKKTNKANRNFGMGPRL